MSGFVYSRKYACIHVQTYSGHVGGAAFLHVGVCVRLVFIDVWLARYSRAYVSTLCDMRGWTYGRILYFGFGALESASRVHFVRLIFMLRFSSWSRW